MQALRRAVYRVGYRLLRAYWLLARPAKRGVKCLLTRGDEILLVRHSYGPRRRWELPGGGIRHGEAPVAAARREIREELGVDIVGWRPLGDVHARIDRKRDRLYCFAAELGARALDPDGVEIAEVGWFALTDLPAEAAPHIAAIIALDRAR